MSHYTQQHYFSRAQQPRTGAPISPQYRQRFEQQAHPPQTQPQALDSRQRPPQYPQQQQQADIHQHGHLRSQPRAQVQVQAQAPVQSQRYSRPQSQYVRAQQQYQPPYALAAQWPQTQVHVPYAPQHPAQVPPPALYAQRTYSYPPPQGQAQPAAIPTPYMMQQSSASAYHARTTRVPALQQQQQAAQYGRPVGSPQTAPSVPSLSSTHTQQPANTPGVGTRRPLPTPAQGIPQARPRPISMTHQSTQSSCRAPQTHHSSSSSLSHMIPQSSVSATSSLPTSSFPSATGNTSPARRPLPSPSSRPTSLPSESSEPVSVGIPRSTNMHFRRTPSPEKQVPVSRARTAPASPSPLHKAPTQSRALPHSPTAPPDLSQLQRGTGVLVEGGIVSQMSSQFVGRGNGQAGAGLGSAVPTNSAVRIPAASPSYIQRSPVRSSTLSATVQTAPPVFQTDIQSLPAHSYIEQDADGSEQSEEEASQSRGQTPSPQPSPQYGIRDLPKRNTFDFSSVANTAQKKSGLPSPQYGIKDLPMRAKSVIDRRRAWERAEHGINSSCPTLSNCGSKSAFEPSKRMQQPPSPTKAPAPSSPTKTSMPSSPKKVQAPALSAPVAPIAPSRSPQPQTPQQEQKLPMPPVKQPQPSYTERKPSWSLPTADLQKIQDRTHAGDQKTSMAFRFAAMSLAEEKNANAAAKALSSQSHATRQAPVRPLAQNNSSRSVSPTRPYPFATRTPRAVPNMDLSLDDPPPPSLRRTPSPSTSTASSSVPSIPTIRTPDDCPGFSSEQHDLGHKSLIPKISQPGDFDYDDNVVNVPRVQVQAPSVMVSSKPASPRRAAVPMISFPDDGKDGVNGPGPGISVSPAPQTPATPNMSMPVILDDLACAHPSSSSPTKSRGLPRPPSGSSEHMLANSSSSSNLRSRSGGLVCGGCHQAIIGRIVSAMSLRWHPECFKCCTCGELLEHVSSYENNAKPYCHLDYHELFAPKCYHCQTPIIDERFITLDDPALGKRTYHEQHFFCAECGDPFLAPSSTTKPRAGPNEISIKGDGAFDLALDEDGGEVGFTVYRGHPYCEACHVRLRAPKCKGCKRSIRDGMRAVEALGGKWCYECFVCAGCQKPFEEPSFFQRDKKPFCEPCFSVILRNEL